MQRMVTVVSVGLVLSMVPGAPALARGGYQDIPFDYCFEADPADAQFAGASILDGTWIHDNGSDAFDGSSAQPDEGGPGGADIVSLPGEGEDGRDASVLLLEDTGDPTGSGFPDPSNRKMFFQKDTSELLDLAEGVTFVIRMRLNEEPISELIPPEEAGYNLHDSGKGIGFVQRAPVGGIQAGNFSLHISNEGNLEFARDFGNDGVCGEFEAEDEFSHCFALQDAYAWNVIWVALEETDEGVHAAIFLNGEIDPVFDDIVFAPPTGYDGPAGWTSYIAMELGSTPQNGSIYIDYFCAAAGFFEPEEESMVAEGTFRRGDVDGNGALEITDPINNLAFQFLGTFQPQCLDALDWDDNGMIEITDPIGNLSRQFLGATPSPAPGSETCGADPTEDGLDCQQEVCQ